MTEKATFAAGCFWHIEEAFAALKGVRATQVGYTGGHVENPTYQEVCSDQSGHAEAVQVEFDPDEISYDELLNFFWQLHDPTQKNRQGQDVGTQYRSAVFYHCAEQQALALKSKQALEASHVHSEPVVTQIDAAPRFYPAEDYHQNYMAKKACLLK